MSSKRRIRRKACDRKQRHATKEEAHQHIYHLHQVQGGEWLRPYHCKFCGGWHCGHSSKKHLGRDR